MNSEVNFVKFHLRKESLRAVISKQKMSTLHGKKAPSSVFYNDVFAILLHCPLVIFTGWLRKYFNILFILNTFQN